MKTWKRFCKKEKDEEVLHNYGLEDFRKFLKRGDFDFTFPDKLQKDVILTNPRDLKDNVTVMGLALAWHGTGHMDWEIILAGWFVNAVVKAIEDGDDEVDITYMFNQDLLASNGRVLKKEQIYNHLIKWFDVVKETPEEVRLRFHF